MELRPGDRAWLNEYRYLRAFPGTSHDQYLDTPREAIGWLLRIHEEVQAAEKDARNTDQQ